ncbi:nucleotide exchange factor GrpE [uncultured Ferrovibrio sp.]|jgi:molecular chaperone GrpE|uniref:nucleotide exchange factor GrpE n=1 Tax=uncultured Ferrovibrio sp. TaxID=1576913 RepID=UPI0026140725|nr:nucleotide exchange factor GrpE [uncultured Ferrovibrio sp.]
MTQNTDPNAAARNDNPGQANAGQTAATDSNAAQNAGQQAAGEAQQPDPLAQAQAEIANLKDQVLRARADAENLRKRLEREREDAVKFAAAKFAKDILTVADNLRRALESAPQDGEGAAALSEPVRNLLIGVEATERELLTVFERHGIARIDPKGQKFDPNLHQAMFEIEDSSVPAGTVLQVVAAGYVQHGRLLRAAMVGVSKGGPQPQAQPGQSVNTQA